MIDVYQLADLYDWPEDLVGDLSVLAEAVEGQGSPLVTGRYQRFDRRSGVPVRTTVGAPRWKIDGLEFASTLAPYGIFGKLPEAEMPVAYEARLEDHTGEVVRQLARLVDAHPGERLCLLCFDDVHAGEECHRRWFASWFERRFGIDVPELPPPSGGATSTVTAKSRGRSRTARQLSFDQVAVSRDDLEVVLDLADQVQRVSPEQLQARHRLRLELELWAAGGRTTTTGAAANAVPVAWVTFRWIETRRRPGWKMIASV